MICDLILVLRRFRFVAYDRAYADGKMCVVRVRATARTHPPPSLTRLRLDGILLSEAHGRCRNRPARAGVEMMEEGTKKGRGTRPRRASIEVWVTPEEKHRLIEKARHTTHQTHSGFLRAVVLGEPLKAQDDLKAAMSLIKAGGDLGRVAGLLKLWLAERWGRGVRAGEVEVAMRKCRDLQTELHIVADIAIHGRRRRNRYGRKGTRLAASQSADRHLGDAGGAGRDCR